MTSRSADFDSKTPSDARDATVYAPAAMHYRSNPFVLCRQIYLTSINAVSAAAVSVLVSSRLVSGVRILWAVWLAYVYVSSEFESRSQGVHLFDIEIEIEFHLRRRPLH